MGIMDTFNFQFPQPSNIKDFQYVVLVPYVPCLLYMIQVKFRLSFGETSVCNESFTHANSLW